MLKIINIASISKYFHFKDEWIYVNKGFILVYNILLRLSFTRI
jgi:hypothetical protein